MNTKRSSISPIPWLKIKWRRYELDLELCIRCQVIRCQPTSTSHLRSIITYFQSITYNYQSGNAPARLEGDRSDCQCSDCINAKKNVSPRLSVVLSFVICHLIVSVQNLLMQNKCVSSVVSGSVISL